MSLVDTSLICRPVPIKPAIKELLAAGRRHLAVRDYSAASDTLAEACEWLSGDYGETGDECAEPYMWYGQALLGLSREESGVLGDGVPGSGNADKEEEDNEAEEEIGENGEANTEAKAPSENEKENGEVEMTETESTTKEKESDSSNAAEEKEESEKATTNVDQSDETAMNVDDVDNLQLAWEILDLSRRILKRRVKRRGGDQARALLADVYLLLGEVALESETYDKAISDMLTCLNIQKELYRSDDRRIAETHYQLGIANSLPAYFDEAIFHFNNAVSILETRIKNLEDAADVDVATVKKFKSDDPCYTAEGEVKELKERLPEIKELKELLPEIKEKIQEIMDYKAETVKQVHEAIFSTNGEGSSTSNDAGASSNASSSAPKPAASDISHLIKRKRKASEGETVSSVPKRVNT